MDCLKRYVEDVEAESTTYKNALVDDKDLAKGTTSYWCIPEEWTKPALELSG